MNYAADMLPAMINACHQDGLHAANNLELGATDLHIAVGEVVGKTSTENLLDSSFAWENNAKFSSNPLTETA